MPKELFNTGAVPIQGRTQPFQIPTIPGDPAELIMQAANLQLNRQKMQQDAMKGLSDSIMGAVELIQREKRAKIENAIASAGLELRDRLASQETQMEQAKLRQQADFQNQELAIKREGLDVERMKIRATENNQQNKRPTQEEFTARGYADKARQADESLQKLETSGFDPGAKAGLLGEMSPNVLKSSDRQSFEQSKRQFINAILRRESGAAISASENENYTKQYFPQAGDSPAVRAQKAQSRALAIKNLESEAGRAPTQLDPKRMLLDMADKGGGDAKSLIRELHKQGKSRDEIKAALRAKGF